MKGLVATSKTWIMMMVNIIIICNTNKIQLAIYPTAASVGNDYVYDDDDDLDDTTEPPESQTSPPMTSAAPPSQISPAVPPLSQSSPAAPPNVVAAPPSVAAAPPSVAAAPPSVAAVSPSPTAEEKLAAFYAKGCGCKLKGGQPCFTHFTLDHFEDVSDQCVGMKREELDLVILAQIMANISMDEDVGPKSKHLHVPRHRSRITFFHHGHRICRTTFLKLHGIGKYNDITMTSE